MPGAPGVPLWSFLVKNWPFPKLYNLIVRMVTDVFNIAGLLAIITFLFSYSVASVKYSRKVLVEKRRFLARNT